MKLTQCTHDELAQLRGAVKQDGSKLIHVTLNVEDDTAYLCARASTQLSASAWAKQLGVPRLQHVVAQCTNGIEEAMRKCRAEWGLELESEEKYDAQAREATRSQPVEKARVGQKRGSDNEEEEMEEAGTHEPTGKSITCDPRRSNTYVAREAQIPPQVETRPLLEVLMTHHFDTFQGNPPPLLPWKKFNQLAAFWYVRTGVEYGNEQHMKIVFQAMHDHPQSNGWWHGLVSEKQAELATGTRCAGVDQELLRFLLGKRVDRQMLCKVEEVWGKFEAWAEEYDAGSKRDTLHTRIQAMGTHTQSDIDWRKHAVMNNRYYHDPAMMCQ
jgi:hypothetical protein